MIRGASPWQRPFVHRHVGVGWNAVDEGGGRQPPPRDHHAATSGSRMRRVTVFGGGRQIPGGGDGRLWLTDLWAGDAERWELLSWRGRRH